MESRNSPNEHLRTFEMKIPFTPVPKARPKFQSKGKGGRDLGFVRTYDPQQKQQIEFKKYVRWYLRKYHKGFIPFAGPIQVSMCFYMPMLKSWPEFKKEAISCGKAVPYHEVKPDLSNLFKFPEDCLNGILWKDDGQVSSFSAFKVYGEPPETVIEIRELHKIDWQKIKSYLTKRKAK